MAVPDYYNSLFVNIYYQEDTAVGSGICFDGKHILTCAHVVNAACGLDHEHYPRIDQEIEITIRFRLDSDIEDVPFIAQTVHWGWNEEILNAMTEERRNAAVMRTDIAILQLKETKDYLSNVNKLKAAAQKMVFLKGNLNTSEYAAWVINPGTQGVLENINGKLGDNDRGTGTTIVYPNTNPQQLFFDSGSSGAPVTSTVLFPDDSMKTGIAGYTQFLREKGTEKEARMINGVNLEDWFKKNYPHLKPYFFDIDKHKASVINRIMGDSLLKSFETKWGCGHVISCNRGEQIEEIRQHNENNERWFLIHGADRQKLDFFVDRYRWEFLDSTGKKSELITVSIPGHSAKKLFCETLVNRIHQAFRLPRKVSLSDELTLEDILTNFALDDRKYYVFNCIIENAALTPQHLPLFSWMNADFFRPLKENPQFANIHVFFSYYYKEGEDYRTNYNMIDAIFKPALQELCNIKRNELEEWLASVEPAKKDRLLPYFPNQEEFSMEEVLRYYKKAIDHLEPF